MQPKYIKYYTISSFSSSFNKLVPIIIHAADKIE